jgi:E3 ubiquitin-protein ligase DCST1
MVEKMLSELRRRGAERESFTLERLLDWLDEALSFCCPQVYSLLLSSPGELVLSRKMFSFLLGTVYSAIIYYLTLYQVDYLSDSTRLSFSTLVLIIISISMSFNERIRCIMTLSVFNFLSSAGKVILTSYVIYNLSNGPVRSIFENVNELGRSIACQQRLMKSLSDTGATSRLDIYKSLLFTVENHKSELDNDGAELFQLLATMDDEVQKDEPDWSLLSKQQANANSSEQSTLGRELDPTTQDQISERYYEKINNRCMRMYTNADNKCSKMINISLSNCEEQKKLGFTVECPNSSYTTVCSKLYNENLKEKCNESIARDMYESSSFGKAAYALHNLRRMFDSRVRVSFDYRPQINQSVEFNKQSYIEMRVNTERFKASVRRAGQYVNLLLSVLKVFANYGFVFVFFNSYMYHHKYLNDISFDNKCITRYFRHLDAKRHAANKRAMLPLKNHEKLELFYPFQLFVSAYQTSTIRLNVFVHASFVVTIVCAFFIDHFLDGFLRLVNEHGLVTYSMRSHNEAYFNISGHGFVANMLREITKGRQFNETRQANMTNLKCLPNVHSTGDELKISIYKQLCMLYALVMFELYIKRANRLICAYYYKKREKERIIWLYNTLLKKRKLFVESSISRMAYKKRNLLIEDQDSSVISLMNKCKLFHLIVPIVRKLGIGVKCCILCNEKQRFDSVACKKCSCIYCLGCWYELNNRCGVCNLILEEYDL